MKRFFLLVALLSACTSPATIPPSQFGVEMRVRLESTALEGELGAFSIRIRNAGTDYILLREILEIGQTASATWQLSLPGEVEYRAEPDCFVHHRESRGTERPVFNVGLLVPGEEISIRTRIRLLNLPKAFRLAYYQYDLQEISRRVYFEKRVGRELRYVRLVGPELEGYLIPSPLQDGASHRTVVFPYAEQVAEQPREREFRAEAHLRPRPFSLENACARLGLSSIEEHTYYAGLELWAIRSGERAWLVSSTRTIELPRVESLASLFHLLDSDDHPKVEVEFRRETKTLFAEEVTLVVSKGTFLTFLPRADLIRFFEKVRAFGLTLGVERSPQAGRVIVTR